MGLTYENQRAQSQRTGRVWGGRRVRVGDGGRGCASPSVGRSDQSAIVARLGLMTRSPADDQDMHNVLKREKRYCLYTRHCYPAGLCMLSCAM